MRAGRWKVWYVPRKGKDGKQGEGYWVGVAYFKRGTDTKVRSQAVYLSYP